MKKTIAIYLSILLTLTFTACGVTDTSSDNGIMRTELTSAEYAIDMGLGINLGNTLDGYYELLSNTTSSSAFIGDNNATDYETCWGASVTSQKTIDGICAAGFKTLRLPVYWGNGMEDDGMFVIRDFILERVSEIVDYCRNDNMYVVINIHHYDQYLFENLSRDEAERAVRLLWTQIAEYFKEYSDYVVFEGFNEAVGKHKEDMTEDEVYDYVNSLNQIFVDSVRATGGNNANRLLIVSGYTTNIDKTTNKAFLIPADTPMTELWFRCIMSIMQNSG